MYRDLRWACRPGGAGAPLLWSQAAYPDALTYGEYRQSGGVEDSAALARLRQRYRKNTFEIPLPTFADLYRNQVCHPAIPDPVVLVIRFDLALLVSLPLPPPCWMHIPSSFSSLSTVIHLPPPSL